MQTSPKRQPLRQASTQSCGIALCAAAMLSDDAKASSTILYTNTTDVHLSTTSIPAHKNGTPIKAVSFDPNHDAGAAPDYATNFGDSDLSFGYFFDGRAVFSQSVDHTVSLIFLIAGQEIGAGLSYASELFYSTNEVVNGALPVNEDAYAGLAYFDGMDYYYGWARVSLADTDITLKDFAMEQTPNTSILAGAVPEPGCIILTFGGLGLATLRRRVVR